MAAHSDLSDYSPRLSAMLKIVLSPDRGFFWQAVIFSIAISVLTLAVPLSVQILIGTVANTATLRPVVVLGFVLFGLLALYGVLVGIQANLMDVFERRLFARVTKDIALRSIHARYAHMESLNCEELANRFFEIITIQRNVPTLVVNGSTVLLQAIVGFAVVSAYHPMFLVFNCVVLLLIYLVWKIWAGPSIYSKLLSSKAKFNVASWLEELGRANAFFKSERAVRFALRTTEQRIANYVAAHRRHFRFKFAQQICFLALYAIASAALLSVGGWLVISNELTLGQLVAAELILSAVFLSLARLPSLLEEFFETCAALYKLGDLFDIPLETPIAGDALPAGCVALRFDGAVTSHRARQFRIDIEFCAGAKVMAVASSYSLQKGIVDLALNHVEPQRGAVLLGERNIADMNLHQLRDGIVVVDNSGVLECSIEENLGLGDPTISRAAMRAMLEVVNLDTVVNSLPAGIDTPLGAFGYPLSRSQTIRLKIAAALLARPQVLVVTQVFDSLTNFHRRTVIDYIVQQAELTFINFSNRHDITTYNSYMFIEPEQHRSFNTVNELLAYERQHEQLASLPTTQGSP